MKARPLCTVLQVVHCLSIPHTLGYHSHCGCVLTYMGGYMCLWRSGTLGLELKTKSWDRSTHSCARSQCTCTCARLTFPSHTPGILWNCFFPSPIAFSDSITTLTFVFKPGRGMHREHMLPCGLSKLYNNILTLPENFFFHKEEVPFLTGPRGLHCLSETCESLSVICSTSIPPRPLVVERLACTSHYNVSLKPTETGRSHLYKEIQKKKAHP